MIDLTLRPATLADAPTIVAHRRAMFEAMGFTNNGIRTIILHASDEGRGLYESLGFRATNEMRMRL